MNWALKSKGVYAFVNGDNTKPVNDAAKLKRWIRDDVTAIFTISSAWKLSQITLMENCMSSKEMMNKLVSIFKLNSVINKMLLLR